MHRVEWKFIWGAQGYKTIVAWGWESYNSNYEYQNNKKQLPLN